MVEFNNKKEINNNNNNNQVNLELDEFNLQVPSTNEPSNQIILTKTRIILILFALILSVLIAGMDETIVATALGSITNDLQSGGQVTWIAASYLLTMTAFEPLYGKFSDIFGRKPCLLFSLILFLVGSIGCGVAQNIITIIIFRALSGIAAGGLISLAFIVVSDIIPIESRSNYLSLINGAFALSYVIGPLLGGVFVDHLTWRWVFYINIPIVIIAGFVVIFVLPKQKIEQNFKKQLARIDLIGTLTLVIGIILFVMGLSWGGKDYSWDSAPVISCLILGILILIGFLYVEKRYAIEPVIPTKIFTRNAILLNLITLLFGFSMFVYMYYWPLYHQTIHASTATQAGIETLPILVGICGLAAISGFVVTKTGRYRILIIIGLILLILGEIFMFRLTSKLQRFEEILYPLFVGIGIGLSIQSCLIACQAAVHEDDVAIITAFVNFSLTMGGVFGLAIQGTIFNNILKQKLLLTFNLKEVELIIESVEYLHNLSIDLRMIAIEAYLDAYKFLFLSLIPFSGLALILSLFVKHIPLVTQKVITH